MATTIMISTSVKPDFREVLVFTLTVLSPAFCLTRRELSNRRFYYDYISPAFTLMPVARPCQYTNRCKQKRNVMFQGKGRNTTLGIPPGDKDDTAIQEVRHDCVTGLKRARLVPVLGFSQRSPAETPFARTRPPVTFCCLFPFCVFRLSSDVLWEKVTLVDIGLSGGSLGLAVRQRRLANRVVGFVRRDDDFARLTRPCVTLDFYGGSVFAILPPEYMCHLAQ